MMDVRSHRTKVIQGDAPKYSADTIVKIKSMPVRNIGYIFCYKNNDCHSSSSLCCPKSSFLSQSQSSILLLNPKYNIRRN